MRTVILDFRFIFVKIIQFRTKNFVSTPSFVIIDSVIRKLTFRRSFIMTKIGIIVGSLREDSFSSLVAKALADLTPADVQTELLSVDLPLYSQEMDEDLPQSIRDFKASVVEKDGIIFVTPEYNRGVPGVLKNAIDAASRPYGDSAWDGIPALVVSQTPAGTLGGFGANHQLRQSLTFLNMPVVQQPEVYLSGSGELFNEAGELKSEDTKAFLASAVEALLNLI